MPSKKPKRAKSDSALQRRIEKTVRKQLARILDWPAALEPRRISYGDSFMEFDCHGEQNGRVLLAEINAHHGTVKSAQRNKVLSDILKMYMQSAEQFERAGIEEVRMVVVFTNAEAAAFLKGRSWAAETARKIGAQSVVVSLSPAQTEALKKTQRDQDLRS